MSEVAPGRKWQLVTAGAVLGAVAAVGLAHLWIPSVCIRHIKRPKASHRKVHVYLVDLTFGSKEDREKFRQWYKGLADRVYANEVSTCLSYDMSFDIDDEKRAIIFERYVSKAALDGPHQASIKAHIESAGPSGVTIVESVNRSFTETNAGFMDR